MTLHWRGGGGVSVGQEAKYAQVMETFFRLVLSNSSKTISEIARAVSHIAHFKHYVSVHSAFTVHTNNQSETQCTEIHG